MRIVITGGAGFLASRLARALLARGSLTDARGESREIRDLVLVDVVPATISDRRVSVVTGDLAEPALIERVVTDDTDSIFHLAAVVSGQAEAEFDIGMRVNLDATRALLERCRKLPRPPKFVFTSSLAVFGGALPDPVPDDAGRGAPLDFSRAGVRPTKPRLLLRAASSASRFPASMRSARWRATRAYGSPRRMPSSPT